MVHLIPLLAIHDRASTPELTNKKRVPIAVIKRNEVIWLLCATTDEWVVATLEPSFFDHFHDVLSNIAELSLTEFLTGYLPLNMGEGVNILVLVITHILKCLFILIQKRVETLINVLPQDGGLDVVEAAVVLSLAHTAETESVNDDTVEQGNEEDKLDESKS